jgi:hypothetical protein
MYQLLVFTANVSTEQRKAAEGNSITSLILTPSEQ